MAKPHTGASANRFEARATADSHFAWLRTRLAVERTMMAWLRTAVALIGFGFTIVQFFDRFEQLPGTAPALFPTAPRYLGLSLIACGVLALTTSIWQYWWIIAYLSSGGFATVAGVEEGIKRTPLYPVSVVLLFIGLFAFFAVYLRYV